MFRRHLPWVLAFAVVFPSTAWAQWGPQARPQQSRAQPGYNEGYQRGVEVGAADARRRSSFNFSLSLDFRRGDIGYRAQFGNRDRYRNEFRRGFELGYETGYNSNRGGGYYARGLPGGRQSPPAAYGRAGVRLDVAAQQGYSDGYEAGLDDGRNGRRFDPVAERRYRNADRGYNNSYCPRERYKASYRSGFLPGYEVGYQDAARYGRRR
jgi:hypothetical protein